jgi:tRNA threonylcarbamoyladenosine biosynthesis protein TsaB
VLALAPAPPATVRLLPPDPLYLRRPDATPPGARKRVLR